MVRVTQRKEWPQQHDEESPRDSSLRPSDASQQSGSSRRTSTGRLLASIFFSLISASILAIFVLAIVYEGTDRFFVADWPSSPRILWIIFEGLNAAVPAMFLANLWICFPVGVFNILTMLANVWAIVYLVIIWTNKSGTVYSTNLQILLYLGMSSTVYHSLLIRYFDLKGT